MLVVTSPRPHRRVARFCRTTAGSGCRRATGCSSPCRESACQPRGSRRRRHRVAFKHVLSNQLDNLWRGREFVVVQAATCVRHIRQVDHGDPQLFQLSRDSPQNASCLWPKKTLVRSSMISQVTRLPSRTNKLSPMPSSVTCPLTMSINRH